jgi:hypothetical protein
VETAAAEPARLDARDSNRTVASANTILRIKMISFGKRNMQNECRFRSSGLNCVYVSRTDLVRSYRPTFPISVQKTKEN